jgi:tetratricopeptide (TPR) repeat protein
MTHPQITLCMIVRDEAELLPRFLSCAAGSYDELCVVDTGSQDDSVRILEQAGARILKEPWQNDFSAVRNLGLAQANGEWILVLDADELLSLELVRDIRALADDEQAGAATFVMCNQLPNGRVRRASLLRMFRNDQKIRFRFPIHEDVSESVSRYLRDTERRLVHLNSQAEHLGYIRERAAARDKRTRDRNLLEKCLCSDPTDLYCWYKLLELARFWNDQPLWREKAPAAADALRAAPPPALGQAHFGGELIALIAQGLHAAQTEQALHFMNSWEERVAPAAAFYLRRAELHEARGNLYLAHADFKTCLHLNDERDQERVTVRPLLGLSRLALASGQTSEAAKLIASALQHNPRDPEALLAHFAVARMHGGSRAVQRAAAEYLATFGDCNDLHQALGEEALLACDPHTAAHELSCASKGKPAGQTGLRLAQATLASGEIERCRALTSELIEQVPEAALGTLVCDLIENRDSAIELDLEIDQASRALRGWVEVVRNSPHQELFATLKNNLPTLANVFPWVSSYTNQ